MFQHGEKRQKDKGRWYKNKKRQKDGQRLEKRDRSTKSLKATDRLKRGRQTDSKRDRQQTQIEIPYSIEIKTPPSRFFLPNKTKTLHTLFLD